MDLLQQSKNWIVATTDPHNEVITLRPLPLLTAGLAIAFVVVGIVLAVLGRVGNTVIPLSVGVVGLLVISIVTFLLLNNNRPLFAARSYAYGLTFLFLVLMQLYGGVTGPMLIGLLVPIVATGLIRHGLDSVGVGGVALIGYTALYLSERIFDMRPLVALESGSSSALFLICMIFGEVAVIYLTWSIGRNLKHILQVSGQRADELLLRTEELMEKGIQQVELGSELSASAAEMQRTSQQQASGATEQASAVSEVSTTTEELGSTARQIAQAAEHVTDAAQRTLEDLSDGQRAVDESIQGMERIRSRMQDISTRILGLGERSQQIGDIIDLIDDISDETHLLALNAAIEAAGAGEHGRRFAVVAAEVKSLANRTLAAAREVKGVIAEIRQATSSAVLAAEEGSKEVERGVELAHRAGQVMDNIVMVAERTAQSAAEISLATAQQQSASEQVVETMREVAEVARQSAIGARQMAESSAMLTAIADRLHGIVQSGS